HAQSSAVTEISAALGAMDQATQQNAAMVEETSAAARNLASDVTVLSEQASRFNVGNGAPMASARVAPSRFNSGTVKPLPAAAVSALVR
ncbi:methyl-accepting chemotaxis protein, partial [Escherichia coli]